MTIRPRVDETGGFAALQEVDPADVIHLGEDAQIEVGTLDGGMASGKPSVAFCFSLPDGRAVVAETSLELLTATASALAAAHEPPPDYIQRFPDDGETTAD